MEQATLLGPGDVGGLPVRTLWSFALYNAADRVVLFLFAVAALPRSDFLRPRKTESHGPWRMPYRVCRNSGLSRAGDSGPAAPGCLSDCALAAFETDGFNSPLVMVSSLHYLEVLHVAQAG